MKKISLLRILEFIVKKRLSFVQALIATLLIVGVPVGLLYYKATRPRYEIYVANERFLSGIQGDIIRDLRETGVSDLREVRKRFLAEWQDVRPPPPPICWTALDVISKEREYDGQVICYIPKRYFGRFARTTMCVALKRDPRRDVYLVGTRPLKGPPDLLREKKTSRRDAPDGSFSRN